MMPRWALFWVGLAALWVWMTLQLLAGVGCPGANPNDFLPDDTALNACLAGRAKAVQVVRGKPGYLIQSGLTFVRPGGKLIGLGPQPAIFRAMPGLRDYMLRSEVDGARLVNLLFHGMKSKRLGSVNCAAGEGANLLVRGNGWLMDRVVSRDAVCRSGAEVEGSGFTIRNSRFLHNGFEWPQGPWADGLTVWRCDGGYIARNKFEDSTDVDLIVGGGRNCMTENNRIEHVRRYGLAGLMVAWFPSGRGDHAGSTMRNNSVSSRPGMLGVGLMVGQHPWGAWMTLPDAGVVKLNTVSGAAVNIWVEGISRGVVRNNRATNATGARGLFGCGLAADQGAAHFGRAKLSGPFVGLRFDPPPCQAIWSP